MKNPLLLLAMLFITNCIPAQNCVTPVATSVFQTNFNQVASLRTDAAKLEKATVFASANCMSSAQIKSMSQLFSADSIRYEFCKKAWSRTTDPANFFGVYDVFEKFSWAIRLYDHTQHPNAVPAATIVQPTVSRDPVFANVAYPDTARTTRYRGCNGRPVAEPVFMNIARDVNQQPTDEAKVVSIETAAGANCFSMAHMMKLVSLVNKQNLRVRLLTNTLPSIYDPEHYTSASALLTAQTDKDQWQKYAQEYITPPPPPCLVSSADFNKLMNDLRAKSFKEDKMGMITMWSNDRCFSVAQIKTISQEFPFGDEKMKIFKMLYAKCTDRNNYYQLVDELTFTSEKDELRNFINNGGK